MPGHSARSRGEVFLDARGEGRALRLTWHDDADVTVLSLWRDGRCTGTFRLALSNVEAFIDALVDGLADAPGADVTTSGGSRHASPTGQHSAPVETGQSTLPELSDEASPFTA